MYVAHITPSHTTPTAAWFRAECGKVSVVSREPEAAMAVKLLGEGCNPLAAYSTVFKGTPSMVFPSLYSAAKKALENRARFARSAPVCDEAEG